MPYYSVHRNATARSYNLNEVVLESWLKYCSFLTDGLVPHMEQVEVGEKDPFPFLILIPYCVVLTNYY